MSDYSRARHVQVYDRTTGNSLGYFDRDWTFVESVHAICFRQDGTRIDDNIPAQLPSYRLIAHVESAPPLALADGHALEMTTFTVEDLPDSGVGSSDGRTVIYAPRDTIRLRQVRIGRAQWESEMDRGLKWRPVKSIAAILTEALGVPMDTFDNMLPKTRQESYYDGNVWRVLDDLFRLPYRQDGVVWETLWVRPQSACPMNGDLRFLQVLRRAGWMK